MTTLQQGTISQALYGGAYFIVGLLINRVSKFSIICKWETPIVLIPHWPIWFSFELVSILAGSGACGIACVLVDLPWLQTSLLTLLVASGTGSNVLNTATVGLYPTTIRGMALCISMMFGTCTIFNKKLVWFMSIDNRSLHLSHKHFQWFNR